MSTSFHSIAVVGAGSVGGFFGARLAAAGHRVTLIGRAAHVDAIRAHGLRVQWADRLETVPAQADTALDAVRDCDLVLVSVKSTDTADTARALAPLLRDDALVLSLQNGVENAATLGAALRQQVVACAVYVATSMAGPGIVAHHGRGDLVIGPPRGSAVDSALQARLQALADLFGTAGVPVQISADVDCALWRKLLVNCAFNAISALTQLPYGRMVELPEIVALQRDIAREVIAVAQADGRQLDFDEALHAIGAIASGMAQQVSSTAQDLARGRGTEIDHLNGFVARRGAELGVPAPVNRTLHALVKLAESAAAPAAR